MKKVRINLGEQWIIQAPFRVGDNLYSPDSGDVTVIIRDNSGTSVYDQTFAHDAFPHNVDASAFNLPEGQSLTHFHGTVTFQSGGLNVSQRVLIEVVQFVPFIYSEMDVLYLLGVKEDELEPSTLNLYRTKQFLESELGITLFDTVLNNVIDNDIVLHKAALEQIPTLALKARHEHRIDDHAEKRFRVDFKELQSTLRGVYLSLVNKRIGQESIAEPILTAVPMVDVITGQ